MILRSLVFFVVLTLFLGCGGKEQGGPKVPSAGAATDDAIALLPGNPIAVGTVDARAFFGSATFGADLTKLVEKSIPIGQEAGFTASRDVDRVTWGSYSYQGVDVAAIVIGRFDEAKIKQAAASGVKTKSGSTIVQSSYAGHDVYTVSNVGFSLLSADRAIVGTESGIWRVLDRIRDNRVHRDIPPWMIQVLETPSAAAAVAGDFASQPLPEEIVRQIPMPFMNGLRAVRAVATFKEGVQVAGSLTYPDPDTAKNASQSVSKAATFSRLLAVVGVRVQTFDVTVDKSDVVVKIAIDDQSLRQLLAQAPVWLGQ